ncbi:hypothetical protein HG530_005533 [Fusarium avenaceum]|nr:hypothetical protein HG530_005533 [Fusarium avenaceum]
MKPSATRANPLEHLGLGRHSAAELEECDDGTSECDATDENAEIGCYHMQSRRIHDISHNTTDTGQDSCKTNNRVKSRNGLREICGGDSLADKHTSNGTKSSETTELSENLGCEASSEQAGQNTCTDTKNTKSVAHTSSSLGSKTRDGTNTENRANKITGLNKTSSTSRGSSQETTTAEYCRNSIKPGVLRGHAFGNDKATTDIDKGQKNTHGTKRLGNGCRNGIRDTHQRRVKRRSNTPDSTVSNKTSKSKAVTPATSRVFFCQGVKAMGSGVAATGSVFTGGGGGAARGADGQFALLGSFTVASSFGSQINNDTSRFHDIENIVLEQFRGRSSRDQCSGDDDVDFFGLVFEKLHFSFDKFLAHFLSIATSTRSIFLDFDLDEFGSKRLNLFTSSWPGIKATNNSPHTTSSSNSTQTSNAGTDNQNFARRNFASSSDLTSEESTKYVGGFKNSFVTGDVGHTTERIKHLSSRDARNHVHGEAGCLSSSDFVDKFLVLGRLEERDNSLAFFHGINFSKSRTTDLENNV